MYSNIKSPLKFVFLKRTVRTLSERYGQLKEEYKRVQESQRSQSSDPDGVTKQLQSTIDSLKRVCHSAQQKLSKKEKEVERLHSVISDLNDLRNETNDRNQKDGRFGLFLDFYVFPVKICIILFFLKLFLIKIMYFLLILKNSIFRSIKIYRC